MKRAYIVGLCEHHMYDIYMIHYNKKYDLYKKKIIVIKLKKYK